MPRKPVYIPGFLASIPMVELNASRMRLPTFRACECFLVIPEPFPDPLFRCGGVFLVVVPAFFIARVVVAKPLALRFRVCIRHTSVQHTPCSPIPQTGAGSEPGPSEWIRSGLTSRPSPYVVSGRRQKIGCGGGNRTRPSGAYEAPVRTSLTSPQ